MTMIMSEALAAKLRELGWNNFDRLTWGAVTDKGMGWVTILSPYGNETTIFAPFVPVPEGMRVAVGEQCAVVRQR